MHEINLRTIDLNLMTVFEVVYQELSQAKASERLAMSQPAISHALGRLRRHVGDRLFTGRSKGLMPTPYADELYIHVHEALDLFRRELARSRHFDPLTSRRTFVACVGYGGGSLVTIPLFKRLRAIAPHVRLVSRSLDPSEELPSLLREHRVDIAFSPSRIADEMMEHRTVYKSGLSVVVREDHPRIDQNATMDQILAEEFVNVFAATVKTENEGIQRLARKFAEKTVLEVPTALILPLAVQQTELLAITSNKMLDAIVDAKGVVTFPLPMVMEEFPSYCIWHKSMSGDPAHEWFRNQCVDMMRELYDS